MAIMFNGSGGVVGMPGPGAGLEFAQNSYNQNQNFFANQAATLNAANSYNPWANSGGSFGAQTAAASAAAAAYGRAVGSAKAPGTYSPGNAGNLSSYSGTPMGGGGRSVFDTGTSGVPYLGGSGAGMPFGGGGFSGYSGSPFSTGAPPINTGGGYAPFGGGGFAPPQQTFNNRFAGGGGGFDAFNPGIYGGAAQPNLGGRGQPKAAAQAPPLTGAPWDMSDPDTPSFGGSSVHQRGMGIQPPFQNYGGFGGMGSFSPSPNYGGGRGGTTTADAGAQPGPSAASLGADAFRRASSPFNIGSSAVPYPEAGGQAFPGAGIGSWQPTNQRDMLANIMSGSMGNEGAQNIGRGFGGQQSAYGGAPIMAMGGDEGDSFADRWGGMQAPATPGFGQGASAVPGLAGRGYFGAVPGGGVGADNSNAFFGGGYPGASGLGQVTPGGRGHFDNAFGGSPSASSPSGSGGIGSDMLRGGQDEPYAKDWHSLIPGNKGLNTPEIIKQINYTAGRGRYDPGALANVIDTESKWNPLNKTGQYRGATQMGPKSFSEAGGSLGGMNWGQYQKAPLEGQIPAYGDWLQHYARPGNAAGLASSGIGSLPVPMQSAILQGTQFGPNSTRWPAGLAEGNMGMNTSPISPKTGLPAPQAKFLGPGGNSPYPTINSMDTYFGRRGG